MNYSGLFDLETHVLLVLSTDVTSLFFLTEHMSEIYTLSSLSNVYPSIFPFSKKYFPFSSLPEGDYTQFSWDPQQQKLIPTPQHLLSEETHSKSILLTKKSQVYSFLQRHLGDARMRIHATGLLQSSIDILKRIEAEQFTKQESGAEKEISPMDWPYLRAVASARTTSLKDAARLTLLDAHMVDEALARTEAIRIIYSDKILAAKEPEELASIRDEIKNKVFTNMLH